MSSHGNSRACSFIGLAIAAAALILLPALTWSQYPGQIKKSTKDAPDLRAVAVLEWTGELGKPKACRMIPVTVFDGEKLQDAGVYLARPQPLALTGEVEYELKLNGKTFGLFDIQNAAQEQGTWVGYGKWKVMPPPKPVKAIAPEKVDEDIQDDKPVLHRKAHADGTGSGSGSGSGTGSGSSTGASNAPAADDDPDRPKLHKKTSDNGGDSSGTDTGAKPADDPDRPKLEKKPGSAPSGNPASSPASSQVPAGDIGNVDSVANSSDPDRPLLKRGKSNGFGAEVVPTLMGLPSDMQQAVAVSDAKSRPDHPWTYSWANPDDEGKMKAAVEDVARAALGLSAPATPPAAPRHTGTATVKRTAKAAAPPPPPAVLADEQFRVFELAYGSGATLVLTAHTDSPLPSQKFVTVIAQPDLYGDVRVLFKSVTDYAHLDETPRMRLVDAVDALADNRAELLFELRGDNSRQFALYRVYRGTAEKLFVSGGGVYGTVSSE
ncbi:MAG TPA: hypothetical protein VGG62_07305 [Terracidiphilus sp.]